MRASHVRATTTLAPATGLPFVELFDDHGGVDRNLDAYPVANPRWAYTSGSGSQGRVRAATGDAIHNAPGFDNVHARYIGPGAVNGGAQYMQGTVANLGSNGEVPELYIRLSAADAGTSVYLSTTVFQLFDWTGSTFTGIDSDNVSLSVAGPHTFGVFVDEDGNIEAGVFGLGRLIGPLTPAQTGVRLNGWHGVGWFRPVGTGVIPFTSLLVGTTKPAWMV